MEPIFPMAYLQSRYGGLRLISASCLGEAASDELLARTDSLRDQDIEVRWLVSLHLRRRSPYFRSLGAAPVGLQVPVTSTTRVGTILGDRTIHDVTCLCSEQWQQKTFGFDTDYFCGVLVDNFGR